MVEERGEEIRLNDRIGEGRMKMKKNRIENREFKNTNQRVKDYSTYNNKFP